MTGEFQHTIDAKGRLFVPAKFREELGEHFIVTKGLDNSLFMYSKKDWDVLEEKIRALPLSKANLQRFFLSSAVECELDAQGRILLPQNLREHAILSREVTVIGVSSRAEIWDTKRWNDYNSVMTSEKIAEAMDEIGF
ncbi:MAG: division/cell wall cluster transcriptional repressor MraZ [Clostridiales bacterium]|nr:division/cell wall cluster transcriptional repressor MraZ [Clostridiales bacterium]